MKIDKLKYIKVKCTAMGADTHSLLVFNGSRPSSTASFASTASTASLQRTGKQVGASRGCRSSSARRL